MNRVNDKRIVMIREVDEWRIEIYDSAAAVSVRAMQITIRKLAGREA